MPASYDNRRYRTTADITVPAGTLVLRQPDGSGTLGDREGALTMTLLDLDCQERVGNVRQLAEGEA